MHVLAIGTQKGGAGKTTTAAALATVLSREGVRVHLIDMDPQSSLTSAFGRRDNDGLLYDALTHQKSLPVIQIADRLTLTPSTIDLERGSIEFMAETGREYMLKSSLQKTDLLERTLVIIDCPPSLGVLAINCLTAADDVLVVVKPGGFELRALVYFQQTLQVLRQRINPSLNIVGAILTEVDRRLLINKDVEEELAKHYPILGVVRKEAEMQYATTEGRVHELTTSKALDDYIAVGQKLREVLHL